MTLGLSQKDIRSLSLSLENEITFPENSRNSPSPIPWFSFKRLPQALTLCSSHNKEYLVECWRTFTWLEYSRDSCKIGFLQRYSSIYCFILILNKNQNGSQWFCYMDEEFISFTLNFIIPQIPESSSKKCRPSPYL